MEKKEFLWPSSSRSPKNSTTTIPFFANWEFLARGMVLGKNLLPYIELHTNTNNTSG